MNITSILGDTLAKRAISFVAHKERINNSKTLYTPESAILGAMITFANLAFFIGELDLDDANMSLNFDSQRKKFEVPPGLSSLK